MSTASRHGDRKAPWEGPEGSSGGLRIEVLTRHLLQRELDAILAIDRQVPHRFAEPWSREHFLFELPGKWAYSLLASDATGVVGYGIRSIKGDAMHAHRTVVRPDIRRQGIGKLLYTHTGRLGVANGYRHLTVKVASCNDAAFAFQRHLGARIYGTEGPNTLFIHECSTLAAGI